MPRTRTVFYPILFGCVGGGILVGCSSRDANEPVGSAPPATAPDSPRSANPQQVEQPPMSEDHMTTASLRGLAFEMADGSTATLEQYQGRVVLVVNVASRCGLTPQVAGLQSLHKANSDRGFTVLAFPSASFNQEPLDSARAAEFCQDMGATYPIAAKVDVRGSTAHPLFARLGELSAEPDWNFTKYLIDREGNLVARFSPRTSPTDPELQQAIDAALAG